MKSHLLLLVSFVILSFTSVKAQCDFLNVGVKLNSSQSDGIGGCNINLDLSFDLSHNNGNKWVNLHIWPTASYPTLPYNKPPKASDLSAAVANIIIDQQALPTVLLSNVYPTDNSVPVQSTGLTVTRVEGATYDRYTITGVSLHVASGCNLTQSFTGDAWSSQANPDNVVHCVSKGFSFIANDPQVTGIINCQASRTYNVRISTVSVAGVSGTYSVYRDNGDGFFNVLDDVIVATDVTWSAVTGSPYISGNQPYAGNNTFPEANKALFVVVTTVGLTNTTMARIDNSCSVLPVLLSDFYASRKNSAVSLIWKTSTELNVKMFEVQKKVGTDFVTVGFVSPTNNANGSTYNFTDYNDASSVSEYRIKTVDNNGVLHFSPIKVVNGFGSTASFSIYPNPSNGDAKVMISDISNPINIKLIDNSGRIIKNITSSTSNSVQLTGLQRGIYLVRMVNVVSGESETKKMVVDK